MENFHFVLCIIFTTFLGMFSNLIVLLISAFQKLELYQIFLCNLALLDAAFCFCCLIQCVISLSSFSDNEDICSIVGILVAFIGLAMMLSLILLAGNRYLAVCKSNTYAKFFTKRSSCVYCAISWLFAAIITFPRTIYGHMGHANMTDPFCISYISSQKPPFVTLARLNTSILGMVHLLNFTLIFFCNFKLYRALKKQQIVLVQLHQHLQR